MFFLYETQYTPLHCNHGVRRMLKMTHHFLHLLSNKNLCCGKKKQKNKISDANSENTRKMWGLHGSSFLQKLKTKYAFALQPIDLREPEHNGKVVASFQVSEKSVASEKEK